MASSKKTYRRLIEIALIIIVLISVRFWVQRDAVSGMAPDFQALTLKGQTFSLYEEKKRPILVHFWATWCRVCKLEQSNIDNIAKDYPVITIAIKSGSNDELLTFLQDENLSFNVINDDNNNFSISHKYKVKGVPVSYIINEKNEIEFVEVGYTTELGLRLRMWWASL